MLNPYKKAKGFTLIEAMITVAIIAILASIGYPSYIEHVNKGRRTVAQNHLMMLAQAMEDYYGENFTYTGAANTYQLPVIYPVAMPLESDNKTYGLQLITTDNSYTIKANRLLEFSAGSLPMIPASYYSTGLMMGDKCGNFVYKSDGSKDLENADAGISPEDCWD